ncbi:MAG: polysaccharide biosynthesis protein [Solirubrobacteraceae bacterium]
MPGDVADDAAVRHAAGAVNDALAAAPGAIALAEAPVAWPSGAHVRVDRLDDEARAGLRRSAAFAAAIGSPVLTIHLFAPQTPEEFRAGAPLDERAIEAFLRAFAGACAEHGVQGLLENVPPILRMRTGGVFLSPVGGHWRDLLRWRARVPELGVTFDTSHAALFHTFAEAYPSIFGLASADDLDLTRYVEELLPHTRVAHVSDAAGILGEGLPIGAGELDLDPAIARLGEGAEWIVAEINEPDPARSPDMKAGHAAIARVLADNVAPALLPPRRVPPDPFDWQAVIGRRDPLPSVLELEELIAGRSVAITGGGGSIGRRLATLLLGFRPRLVTLIDAHEPSLAEDRRARARQTVVRVEHALCDVRDGPRIEEELRRARPDVVFHLAAYKHVDWAERYPQEFVATNLDGSQNVLRAAERAGAGTVVVASTDKAARAAGLYGRTKRLMEQLALLDAERHGGDRIAVRLVNVLGTAGSASDLFLRQARASVPVTITDPAMIRYWITAAHAATLLAHGALLAGEGARVATAADPAELSVGLMAERIWTGAGHPGAPRIATLGVRPGEVMREILVGPGETLGAEVHQGAAAIAPGPVAPEAGEAVDRLADARDAAARRRVWLEVLGRPGAFAGGAGPN